MENPAAEVSSENTLCTPEDDASNFIQQGADDGAPCVSEGKYTSIRLEGLKPSLCTKIRREINPGTLGCSVVMLILGMLLAFTGKDLFITTFNQVVGGTAQPAATATPMFPRSLILLGTSPDGRFYYFNSPTGIFYRDSDATSKSIAALPAFEAFHWSPQGDKIAFVVHDRNDSLPLLYVLDLDHPPADGQLHLITKRDPDGFPASFGLKAESPLAWSQDEKYIAFVAYDQTRKAALFVSEVDTGKVRRLTEGTEPVTSVAWELYEDDQNMDHERIVYVLIKDGRELIYSVEKDGAENNPWRH
jgi:hypothetical protein